MTQDEIQSLAQRRVEQIGQGAKEAVRREVQMLKQQASQGARDSRKTKVDDSKPSAS